MNKDAKYYVELFHLLFLDLLGRKVDKRACVLKGGCNMRFFMRSFRYSEDIDLDAHMLPKEKLELVVNGILGSDTFRRILRINGINIQKSSLPKQTNTTQRWKLLLTVDGRESPLNTKIEFSRRGVKDQHAFENVDPLLIETYSLAPIMANHYTKDAAFRQKVEALITRSVTQARDVFDLHLLLSQGANTHIDDSSLLSRLDEAVQNAMSISYDMFRGQVFSFLHPGYQSQYASVAVWDDMVLKVVEALKQEG
jgi:predicted nucleotidyltransferase component of viral defense system